MPKMMKRLLAGLVLMAAPGLAPAQQGQDAQQQAQQTEEGQAASPVEEYRQLLRQISALEVYNSLLQRQITNQEEQLTNIQQASEGVPDLERQIPPLLMRMVNGLDEFVALDLPFYREERENRVAELQTMLEDSSVSLAQKMRRVLEAYQIEVEYGRTVEAYQGQLELDSGTRQVNFLKLGRIALLYQTVDESGESGIWDPEAGEWTALGGQHRNSVRQALRMARNQVAPELVLLPLWPPVMASAQQQQQ